MGWTKLSSAVDNNTRMNGTVWISVKIYKENLFFSFLLSGYNADIFLDVKTEIEGKMFIFSLLVFCLLAGVIEVNS